MSKITWNTDVNAPCCPGEIVNDDGRTVLIQADWDYPGTARTFGWDIRQVTKELPDGMAIGAGCLHEGTDGTVRCPNCKIEPGVFIESARQWLGEHDGATADDPGYFG